jgi:3D (Asp-Asp-Asp) domain-containing protein
MLISQSWRRRVTATLAAAVLIVFFYETTTRDSRYAARLARAADATGAMQAGAQIGFAATAYCKGETTSSGAVARTGIAAADPGLLPVGSVVRVDLPDARYTGIWTVMDTGPEVQGREIDLYLWSCKEALAFGRRPVRVTVLRLGWNPQDSGPGLVDRLFRRREAERTPAPPVDSAQPAESAPPPTPAGPTAPPAGSSPPPAAGSPSPR